jgi:hypothetical protein
LVLAKFAQRLATCFFFWQALAHVVLSLPRNVIPELFIELDIKAVSIE